MASKKKTKTRASSSRRSIQRKLLPGRRAERSAVVRDRILSVAARMFAERGFDSVTTREIAKEAKITFPVMYRQFHDKRGLYLAACGSVLGRLSGKYSAVLSDSDNKRPESRLLGFVSRMYADLLNDTCVFKLMQREILDRDDRGIEQLTRAYFFEPYNVVKQICVDLVGPDEGEYAALAIYVVTFGFIQFRPIGQVISNLRWRDSDAMARRILRQVLPATDWSAVARA
jgi:AcrR family transcriptional regulator